MKGAVLQSAAPHQLQLSCYTMKITQLTVEGFRSLRQVCWQPGDLNIIIGPNGTGKTNVLRLLELMVASAQGKLGASVQAAGGMDPLVWDGVAIDIRCVLETSQVDSLAGQQSYSLELRRLGNGSSYRIEKEHLSVAKSGLAPSDLLLRHARSASIFDLSCQQLATPEEYLQDEESLLAIASGPFAQNRMIPAFQKALSAIAVYGNLNTRADAPIRQTSITRMEHRVAADGHNLISVLHTLYTGDRQFKADIHSAMRAAFGEDFEELVFPPAADQRIQLRIRWKSLRREQSAAELSDGTLCFLYLLAILASPSPAPIIAIDEPETGLHPSMMPVIAEFAIDCAQRSQIIFTTHSPQLLNAFGAVRPTTTVAKWQNGETTLSTIRDADLAYWLKEYAFGTLFQSGELEQMV
jgi:predicted ATPase